MSRRFWYSHVKKCQKHSCKKVLPVPVGLLRIPDEIKISDEFRKNILSKFRSDATGEMCRKDATIIRIGAVFYNREKRKLEKSVEVRKSVRNDMRRLANLYRIFIKQSPIDQEHSDAADMFNRVNFDNLKESIELFTAKKNSSGIKPGLKQNLFYLIKRTAKILKGIFLTQKRDDQADEVDKFVSILEMFEDYIFGDATYELNKNKNVRLRKPSQLPDEDDVKTVRDHVMKRMKELVEEPFNFFDSSCYVELRDCACSRLTLLNARRGKLCFLYIIYSMC